MHAVQPSARRQIAVAALILAVIAVIATVGSLATVDSANGWYADARKVAWNPPNTVFGPAWSILYVLVAAAGFLIWRSGYLGRGRRNQARPALRVYALQLALNGLWTPVFFAGYPVLGRAAWWAAMVIILALILAVGWLIALAARRSRAAAWLLAPYFIWLVFASSLNAGIIALN